MTGCYFSCALSTCSLLTNYPGSLALCAHNFNSILREAVEDLTEMSCSKYFKVYSTKLGNIVLK